MTTILFVPPPTTLFRFTAVLDDAEYTVIVPWNTAAQRWYVNVSDSAGSNVVTIPMVGSPPDNDISLVAGYFTSTLVFRQATQTFEISP